DRVAEISMRVARVPVEVDEVLAQLAEERRLGGIAGKEVGDVIRRAPHQPEGELGPFLRGNALRAQVVVRARDLPAAPHGSAALGRHERHRLAVLGRGGEVGRPRLFSDPEWPWAYYPFDIDPSTGN